MHYASHILIHCIVLWCAINGGETARNAISPEILANFAKNIASVLSPTILGELQSRNNRSFHSILTIPTSLTDDDLNSSSNLDNIVDETSNAASYYKPNTYPYNGLYEVSPEGPEGPEGPRGPEGFGGPEGFREPEESKSDERFEEFLRDKSYLRQEQPNFYRPYDFIANNGNFDVIQKSTNTKKIESNDNIEESPTSLYSSYHGGGFHKAAFAHGPFLAKPYGGFHGFGPYGNFHGHHGHHPYDDSSSDEGSEGSEENARLENRTNHYGYGPPFGNHGFHHPYSPFPYGGYGNHNSFHGPHHRNGNNSSEHGQNGHYGPFHHGPDFYGPPGYGYNHGHYRNNNGDNSNSRQTEASAEDGDQNNSTKNGYPHPYGPPLVKPLVGAFQLHGFPGPFNLLPYNHFHGVFKHGPVVGVGHVGYPIYADPYPIGFPFHHPYGPFFQGKKYLPPKGKPSDSGESGESTETPAGELSEGENPERITGLNQGIAEGVAVASTSNRYKTERKGLKRVSLINFEGRKI